MGCLAAEAKCVTQKITCVTVLLVREKKKDEEIHKVIIHIWLSGRLHLSSLFSVSLPPLLLLYIALDFLQEPLLKVSVWWMSMTLSLEGLFLTLTVV